MKQQWPKNEQPFHCPQQPSQPVDLINQLLIHARSADTLQHREVHQHVNDHVRPNRNQAGQGMQSANEKLVALEERTIIGSIHKSTFPAVNGIGVRARSRPLISARSITAAKAGCNPPHNAIPIALNGTQAMVYWD